MHAFDVLGDSVRRRAEFGISQPAVSQHLRVLRDSGFASVQAEGTRRLYAVEPAPLREVDAWRELARGKRARRMEAAESGLPETDKDGT